jgi:hypothetical protein
MKPGAVSGVSKMETKMTEQTTEKSRPTHTIYKVMGEGESGSWVKVGVAFPHKDGKGLHLLFDGIPVEGRIAVRVNREARTPEQSALAV